MFARLMHILYFLLVVQHTHVMATDSITKVLNVYSARHYSTDEELYQRFTQKTGIKINRIDSDDPNILTRLRNEGKASPADVILLVDAARLWRAEEEKLFQPIQSALLKKRIPEHLRSQEGSDGIAWFGFSTRARVIVYNKQRIKPEDVNNYEALAKDKNKGQLCTRSGAHPYNVSLFAALLEHFGEAETKTLLKGYVDNFSRQPVGNDTDQIRDVASGKCGVTIANSYYLARLMASQKPDDQDLMKNVGIVWPNQDSFGTHINIAGGGVARHAPHHKEAIRFLEYLASDDVQHYFAKVNHEWPVVPTVQTDNTILKTLGTFKPDLMAISTIGANQKKVLQLLDHVAYK